MDNKMSRSTETIRRISRLDGGSFWFGGSLATLRAKFALWQRRIEQRRILAGLNDHLLKDMGITRRAAVAEARKPFWLP
ncbi:MAG TPA: DUF1127 domain-containing protein [Alphaproteobacteria bacterium]|nr:DUF1127 domain-containing protein [Alphaproteobacteria bacterium]